jgi:hypothetical protein
LNWQLIATRACWQALHPPTVYCFSKKSGALGFLFSIYNNSRFPDFSEICVTYVNNVSQFGSLPPAQVYSHKYKGIATFFNIFQFGCVF